jgi:hypothetical protein
MCKVSSSPVREWPSRVQLTVALWTLYCHPISDFLWNNQIAIKTSYKRHFLMFPHLSK